MRKEFYSTCIRFLAPEPGGWYISRTMGSSEMFA